ncbi:MULTISPECIES: hypothetical protein [Streptomyces]|uniref:Uncharacterized protein n=2 Tax=Streptomyces TaxID=1883 RepID=A0A100Y040_9ACTN|nr:MULTISPECIES: hypothetical protein [Streptomyces]KUH35239.1 hypothetical protein ATE80_30440 [Streptomyces kanasensis]UUS31443.1 hypothetical protein NRO40_11765 [Streptomyces changanensis]
MGFDEEWAQLRAEAAERQDTAMRLNQLPADQGGSGGTGGGKLVSSPAEKKAAANTIETRLVPDTKKATDFADEATSTAIGSLKDWQTSTGLKTVQETWDKQVKTLVDRLNREKGALRATVATLGGVDVERRQRIQSVPSSLDAY